MELTLQTKNAVTHIDVDHIVTGGTRQGVIKFDLLALCFITNKKGEERIEAQYQYIDDKGKALPTSNRGVMKIEGNVSQLSASLGNTDPSCIGHMAKDVEQFAKQEMAERFNISVNDIEKISA